MHACMGNTNLVKAASSSRTEIIRSMAMWGSNQCRVVSPWHGNPKFAHPSRDAGFFFKSAWPRVSEWRCRRSRAMRTWMSGTLTGWHTMSIKVRGPEGQRTIFHTQDSIFADGWLSHRIEEKKPWNCSFTTLCIVGCRCTWGNLDNEWSGVQLENCY